MRGTLRSILTADNRGGRRSLARLAKVTIPVAAALSVALSSPSSAFAVSTSWTKQVGTVDTDTGEDVAGDSGGYTIVGTVYRAFAGPHLGYSDGYIRRYDHTGKLIWQRQFGTKYQENARAVTSDSGGFTVVGDTDGNFPGYTGAVVLGDKDIFVRRYGRDGKHLWTRQFGTTSLDDDVEGLHADSTGVTVAGTTDGNLAGKKGRKDGFIRRYDRQGNVKWTRQFGTAEDENINSVSGDANGFTVGGSTNGNWVGTNAGPFGDAFLRRYDRNGNVKWTKQFGQHGDDWVHDIATDSTGITVVGPTRASASDIYYFDGFVRRYDFTGKLLWARIFGGLEENDLAYGVAADSGGLSVTGYTAGSLDGTHRGSYDIFVRRYDRTGKLTWRTQFGTAAAELPMAVAAYGNSFAVVGHTQGSIAGTNKGDTDIVLRRYTR